MLIKLEELTAPLVYSTMAQTVLPRPIAWILSENQDSSYNLAPFSYFCAVSSDPPLLMLSIGKQDDGRDKDTLRNIKARPECVIHIASCDQLPELNRTSATLPPGVSEVEANNLDLTQAEGLRMPRLSACKIAFFCDRYEIQTIGSKQQILLFVEISAIYIDNDCAETNQQGRLKVHADRIKPLSRLGASEYASFGDIIVANRPA